MGLLGHAGYHQNLKYIKIHHDSENADSGASVTVNQWFSYFFG